MFIMMCQFVCEARKDLFAQAVGDRAFDLVEAPMVSGNPTGDGYRMLEPWE